MIAGGLWWLIFSWDYNEKPDLFLQMKEGNVLFNDAVNTFYLWLCCIGPKVYNHSDTKRGNPLPPLNGLLFFI